MVTAKEFRESDEERLGGGMGDGIGRCFCVVTDLRVNPGGYF